MFPTLDYLINYIFGTNLKWYFPPSFGFMVAMAFLCAAWVLSRELKRKEKLGYVHAVKKKVVTGKPASITEMVLNGIFGFVLGWKLVGALLDKETFGNNPQAYLLSSQGNIIAGLVVGGVFAYMKYREKEKKRLPEPKEEIVDLHPYQMTGSITMIAAISGILGAKIFHQLEYWDQFIQDPVGSLVSTSGLTFYGGLIGGVIGVWLYAKKQRIKLIHIADAVAPGLILAYAVGRIGCMLSGDGDWGIINSAYRIDDGKYSIVAADSLQGDLEQYYPIYAETPDKVAHAYYPKPGWLGFLPNWMFAFDFPHNVNEEGVKIANCEGKYCSKLPLPVFPTAFYETIMGLLIFGGLWLIRKRIAIPGLLFSIYLVLNGIERYLIEQIRVNSKYSLGGIDITQAELIAIAIIVVGVVGIIIAPRFKDKILKS